MRNIILFGITIFLLTGCTAKSDPSHATPPATVQSNVVVKNANLDTTRVIGVEELMKHASNYPGRVSVEGVVSEVSTKANRLELIDRKEYDACKEVGCAELSLPVRWSGAMPKPRDLVQISGSIGKENGKSIFIASEIHIVPKVAS